jgi:hypothetical protein
MGDEALLRSMLFPRGIVEGLGGWDSAMTVREDWDFVLRSCELASVVETRDARRR